MSALALVSTVRRSLALRACLRATGTAFLAALLLVPATASVAKKPPKVTIEELRTLKFGKVAGDANGSGTVTINPATGAKTVTGFVFDMGRNDRTARFRIEGPEDAWVLITLPTSVQLTRQGGGGTATLRSFTSDPPAGLAQLNRRGKLTINVGGTMDVAAGQPDGDYEGDFTISVDLQ